MVNIHHSDHLRVDRCTDSLHYCPLYMHTHTHLTKQYPTTQQNNADRIGQLRILRSRWCPTAEPTAFPVSSISVLCVVYVVCVVNVVCDVMYSACSVCDVGDGEKSGYITILTVQLECVSKFSQTLHPNTFLTYLEHQHRPQCDVERISRQVRFCGKYQYVVKISWLRRHR